MKKALLGQRKMSEINKLKLALLNYRGVFTYGDNEVTLEELVEKNMGLGLCHYLVKEVPTMSPESVMVIAKYRFRTTDHLDIAPITSEEETFSRKSEAIKPRIEMISLLLRDIRKGRIIYKNGSFKRPFFKNLKLWWEWNF